MIWREKRILLIVLALLLIGNTIFFFTYRIQYEARLKDLDDRRAQSEAHLAQERAARVTAERRVLAVKKAQLDVRQIYDQQWSTESRRLIALITEVERLASASQLGPPAKAFVRGGVQQTQVTTTSRRGRVAAETVGINFTVKGNYQQIRRLINLLELARQLEQIDQPANLLLVAFHGEVDADGLRRDAAAAGRRRHLRLLHTAAHEGFRRRHELRRARETLHFGDERNQTARLRRPLLVVNLSHVQLCLFHGEHAALGGDARRAFLREMRLALRAAIVEVLQSRFVLNAIGEEEDR